MVNLPLCIGLLLEVFIIVNNEKKSVYKRKLARILRSTFREYESLQSYTAQEACQYLRQISFKRSENG